MFVVDITVLPLDFHSHFTKKKLFRYNRSYITSKVPAVPPWKHLYFDSSQRLALFYLFSPHDILPDPPDTLIHHSPTSSDDLVSFSSLQTSFHATTSDDKVFPSLPSVSVSLSSLSSSSIDIHPSFDECCLSLDVVSCFPEWVTTFLKQQTILQLIH